MSKKRSWQTQREEDGAHVAVAYRGGGGGGMPGADPEEEDAPWRGGGDVAERRGRRIFI